jgi:hypothetical protein
MAVRMLTQWRQWPAGALLTELGGGVEDLLVNRLRVAQYEIPSRASDRTDSGTADASGSEEATGDRVERQHARRSTSKRDR